MAIQGVETKCYILALFVRDDDERFLLGSGHYEFKDSQKQFSANTIQNDVVEVQGNDGFLLAGQVRRPGTQSFDGYIGDGTTEKTEVEEYRRQFFGFFRKNHFYRVIYVFPDGSAIQRKRGFLVDDATVQELYQQYPEYHVALNFEDVNYYTYSENEQGEEIYAEEAQIDLSSMLATGGLVWDEYGAVNQGYAWGGETTVSGTEFTVQNDLSLPAPITDTRLNGDAYQQTYSGKNLISKDFITSQYPKTDDQMVVTTDYATNAITMEATGTSGSQLVYVVVEVPDATKTYTLSGIAKKLVAGQDGAPRLWVRYRTGNDGSTWGNFSEGFTRNRPIVGNDYSFEFNVSGYKFYQFIFYNNAGNPVTVGEQSTYYNIQLEEGSATAYEPYVGGIPAPNPDYPQEIQTVSGEQTVSVSGKNLWKPAPDGTSTQGGITSVRENGTITLTGTSTATSAGTSAFYDLDTPLPAGTYTFSIKNALPYRLEFVMQDSDGTNHFPAIAAGSTSGTVTTTWETVKIRNGIGGYTVGTEINLTIEELQLEAGSTATDFAPYQYQSYPISLGSTELCKLGDYQDYIYKGADGWYVHKAVGKAELGTLNWNASATNQTGLYRMATRGLEYSFVPPTANNIPMAGLSSHFIAVPADSSGTYGAHTGVSSPGSGRDIYIYSEDYNTSTSASDFKTWLANNNVVLYYALATPTDTKITDATLVSQLDVLGSAKLMVGENNVLVSATGTNLPAELQIKYYTTVSFDGAGFVWDEGGSGGPTTVQIDSITNVYPIWTVKGPAVNPELSVITTNTTLKYEGSVGANQTLVIDMMNKTAKLNGTSVIGNVTGDWVNFVPGINRVVYITDNADTPPSLIEWQEVVG